MKAVKYFRILKQLAAELDDNDLTVSMALSNGGYYVSVSTHTSSKWEFDHGGYQRTVQITEKDFNLDNKQLLKELVNIYSKLLKKVEDKKDAPDRNTQKL